MRKFRSTEEFIVDDIVEAEKLMKELKEESQKCGYTLGNCGYTKKEKKKKGEVIAVCYVVKVSKVFSALWEELDEG